MVLVVVGLRERGFLADADEVLGLLDGYLGDSDVEKLRECLKEVEWMILVQ